MKETVNVSIGTEAFTLDRDAYDALRRYLDEIRRRLPEGDTETMDDIERRIAEIFHERVNTSFRVVSLELVQTIMQQLGSPDDFGECPEGRTTTSTAEKTPDDTRRRLYRSRSDRSIAGVCGGLADYLQIDATVLRILTLILILIGGLSIWIYLLLWLIIPEEPRTSKLHR